METIEKGAKMRCARKHPQSSVNLLTTSDNLWKVANPVYIGVLTTLQPFFKKNPYIENF